jgi:hypothetical protein
METDPGLERPQNGLLKRGKKLRNLIFEELDVLFGRLETCHGTEALMAHGL